MPIKVKQICDQLADFRQTAILLTPLLKADNDADSRLGPNNLQQWMKTLMASQNVLIMSQIHCSSCIASSFSSNHLVNTRSSQKKYLNSVRMNTTSTRSYPSWMKHQHITIPSPITMRSTHYLEVTVDFETPQDPKAMSYTENYGYWRYCNLWDIITTTFLTTLLLHKVSNLSIIGTSFTVTNSNCRFH
jgi:hypothetical protein